MMMARMADAAVPASRPARREVDGILLLDKPVGLTSNAALQRVKRLFRARKAGHTGSLDPLASGMLPVCLGQATKVSAFLLDADKAYTVTAQFGTATDTADAEGVVIAESALKQVSRDRLEQAMAGLRGEISQVPPMYSALKQGGRRLYELARAGQQVERAPRQVWIRALDIEHFDPSRPVLTVRCSKGTYVRTLVEDLALACGSLAHVAALRRSEVTPFCAGGMVTMEQLEAAGDDLGSLDSLLRPVDEALAGWPAVRLSAADARCLCQGQSVRAADPIIPGRVRLYEPQGRFLGMGEVDSDGRLFPRRLFV